MYLTVTIGRKLSVNTHRLFSDYTQITLRILSENSQNTLRILSDKPQVGLKSPCYSDEVKVYYETMAFNLLLFPSPRSLSMRKHPPISAPPPPDQYLLSALLNKGENTPTNFSAEQGHF